MVLYLLFVLALPVNYDGGSAVCGGGGPLARVPRRSSSSSGAAMRSRISFSGASTSRFASESDSASCSRDGTVGVRLVKGNTGTDSGSMGVSKSAMAVAGSTARVVSNALSSNVVVISTPSETGLRLIFGDIDVADGASTTLCVGRTSGIFVAMFNRGVLRGNKRFGTVSSDGVSTTIFSGRSVAFGNANDLSVGSPRKRNVINGSSIGFTDKSCGVTTTTRSVGTGSDMEIGGTAVALSTNGSNVRDRGGSGTRGKCVCVRDNALGVRDRNSNVDTKGCLRIGANAVSVLTNNN